MMRTRLLLVLLVATLLLLGSRGLTLALDTAGTTTTVWRSERKVDVFLGVETDDERGDVDNLLANAKSKVLVQRPSPDSEENGPNVPLTDEDTGVVDRLGEATLEDLGLETTLQEILDLEGQHVIETHAALIEHTDADEPADEGVTLEETLRVLGVELEQLTGSTTDLGQDETNAPDLALVAQAVLASELACRKASTSVVRSPRDHTGRAVP